MNIGLKQHLFLLLTVFFLSQNVVADVWDDAENSIIRLHPETFADVPTNIIEELVKRDCTIPQPLSSGEPVNIISGEFAQKGQKDWAALCSKNGYSVILIFWGGLISCPSEINRSEDRNYLQDTGFGIGYSREISTVGESVIRAHFEAYGGVTPPSIEHHAIDDAFVEKGSSTYYCREKEWVELTGSD